MAPHNVPFDEPLATDPLSRAIEQTQPRNLLDVHAGDHTLWLPDTATLAETKLAAVSNDQAFGRPLSPIAPATALSPHDSNRRVSILWELAHTPEQHHFDSALVGVTASTLTPLPSDSRAPWFLVLLAVAAVWWALQASSRRSTRWAIETNAQAAKPPRQRPKQASLAPGIQTREMRQVVRHARRIQSRRRMNARRDAANQTKSG